MKIHLFEPFDYAASCRRGCTPPDHWKTTVTEIRVTCGRCKRIIAARRGARYNVAASPAAGRQ